MVLWHPIVHYSLHLLAPAAIALFFGRRNWLQAYLIMLATMLVDLDHLLATPMFDPSRCSVGFHPLHSYVAIACYAIVALLPWRRLGVPWQVRCVGVGLLFHMFTDWQDYYLWMT